VACSDDPGVAALPCGHRYCAGCLTGVMRNSMTDGTAFPPRCCRQPIDIEQVRRHLEPEFAVAFDNKAIELNTVNPIYCYDATCSTFIPPSVVQGADVADCPGCQRRTCTHCKHQAHANDCQQDEGLQQLLQMAEGEGWRRCECGRVIELDVGCNHMTVSESNSCSSNFTDQCRSANVAESSAIFVVPGGKLVVALSGWRLAYFVVRSRS
jgi:hypothetical protein